MMIQILLKVKTKNSASMRKVCRKLHQTIACVGTRGILPKNANDFDNGLFVHVPGPIPVPLFPQHVATLHADGDIGFSKEYEAIQSVSFQGELNSEHSMNEDNKNKNRYLNIVACKYSSSRLLRFLSILESVC